MRKYNLIDIQTDEITLEHVSFNQLKEYAFDIMENRSKTEQDDLAAEFKDRIKNGVNGLCPIYAVDVLKDWEYKIEEI